MAYCIPAKTYVGNVKVPFYASFGSSGSSGSAYCAPKAPVYNYKPIGSIGVCGVKSGFTSGFGVALTSLFKLSLSKTSSFFKSICKPVVCEPGTKPGQPGKDNPSVKETVVTEPLPGGGVKITGTSGNDKLVGTDCDDDISGGKGNDTLIGGKGNDVLDGESGADVMIGGAGDDIYYVDNPGDKVIENPGEGDDTVLSTIDYTAPDNVENITALTNEDINLYGNDLNNVLHGNDGANVLEGRGGNDNLYGHGGDDILIGGDGNDFLNGGAGNDILNGGNGCDTYVFGFGFDHDTIIDFNTDPSHTNNDILQFESGVKFSDLCFDRCGDDLQITLGKDGSDSVTVANWFKGSDHQIEEFVFQDDNCVTWSNTQINEALCTYGNFFCGTDLNNLVQQQQQTAPCC